MPKKAVNRKISAPAPTCSESSNSNKSSCMVEVVEAETTSEAVSKTKVPCEFCNEPCSLEALMRHQVSADSGSRADFWMLDWFSSCTHFSSKWFFHITKAYFLMMVIRGDVFFLLSSYRLKKVVQLFLEISFPLFFPTIL